MTWSISSCFITLVVLFLWRIEDVAEACRCAPVHLQQAFCSADVVIRAKVVGVKAVSGNTNYDVQQIKMFKGPDRVIHTIFTSSSSASCGVTLELTKEYLFTGRMNTDGRMRIVMCDFIQYWEDLNHTQRKSLTQRYQSGCDCTIIRCSSLPCPVSAPDECLWTDWLLADGQSGPQAKYSACLKRSDGSCAWYREMAPSRK
ncbi:metalloproteinase inhibitor 2 [Salmo salar]|uniref:Metalloproteinase inhibitor 2 n=1 Tax=Salmo salar TaxID=8030 RepID=A0A1S3QG01_SALSA|nr:metalloproteinase inhibitor 2-like [Salmo salar]|eukprot:XP_014038928.1 PREDICTED: metalloproteinase inhibitor 2-like [Salmo salar]